MKYRAGVSPKRANPKRKSEYEYKYGWKKPVDSAPLLAAEQVSCLPVCLAIFLLFLIWRM